MTRNDIDAIYRRDPYYQQQMSQQPAQPQPVTAPHTHQPQAIHPTVQQAQPEVQHDTTPDAPQHAPRQKPTKTIQPLEASNYQKTAYTHQQPNLANHTNVEQERWKQYHSAWQNYYQEYFKRYYSAHINSMEHTLQEQTKQSEELRKRIQSNTNAEKTTQESYTERDAISSIRADLNQRISDTAKKISRNRHFKPVVAGLVVMTLLMGINYNRVLIAYAQSYTTPGIAEPEHIIIDPTQNIEVGQDSRLIIPKINIDVPVIYETTPDHESQQKAMEQGVAWFGIPGANSRPGQVGNTVLSGHSSNGFLDNGEYKFIFARLDHMQINDVVYTHYKGIRYSYVITKKEVVKPTDVKALTYKTNEPVLTLITCTPLGTADKRLLVTAKQVSPSATSAKKAPTQTKSNSAAMPGNSPTLLESLFGG